MAVVQVAGGAFAHPGGAPLFEDVGFKVRSGQHVALVGANGVGKSTLLRCIVGEHALTEGTIHCDGTVALMPQAIGTGAEGAATVRDLLVRFAPSAIREAATALQAAERANAEHATTETGLALGDAVIGWADVGGYDQESRWDAACAAILGAGLDQHGGRPVATLSGGERKRLVLESLLVSDADVLLLDEPDNFLDIPAKRWLERRLRASTKTVLVVSHDRELLANAADAVVTIEGHGAWTHPGGWATYAAARETRNEALGDARARWKAEERRLFQLYKELKQRASISDANAKKAAAAEHRWERWVETGPPPPPPRDEAVKMRLDGADSGRIVLRCEQLEIAGLTDAFDLEVHLGDRVAVLGPNGTGKSHLLRLLGGDPTVEHEGGFRLGARVTPGLFHQTDEVAAFAGRTPLEVLAAEHDLVEGPAMSALGRYGLADTARRSPRCRVASRPGSRCCRWS
jgi:ATPase subunit of ABC transporter with duplicated ATPase domains